MGDKMVCLNCRKAFSAATDNVHKPANCPKCGNAFIFYNHKFRPPKKTDLKAWKVVSLLNEHGFNYQHIYKDLSLYRWYDSENQVAYPKTLDEAREFIIKYKKTR